MFVGKELADELGAGILKLVPNGCFVSLECGSAAEQTIDLFRCQAFFKNTFNRLGVVHQACAFGEQILEFAHDGRKFIRWNNAKGLCGGNNELQFILRKKFK
ncbi:hypothetical protein D3C80_1611350 [compost metagenome]